MGKPKENPAVKADERTFKRARWKHVMRWSGVVVVGLLNLSLVASNIRLATGGHMDLRQQLTSYLFLIFLDVVFLLPAIFEADSVIVTAEELIVSTLVWRARLKWGEILSCRKPAWLAYAVVKTGRCFYLINKRDIPEFPELLELIDSHLKKVTGCILS